MKPEPETAQPTPPETTEDRAPLILIADDEPLNVELLKRRLEWEHYSVVTARNGSDAVEKAKLFLPDLIILDVMMPVMDGLQACRVLKDNSMTRDLPVIFLSALDDTETTVNGLSLGANDFISKPFRPEELIARVAVAIRLQTRTRPTPAQRGRSTPARRSRARDVDVRRAHGFAQSLRLAACASTRTLRGASLPAPALVPDD